MVWWCVVPPPPCVVGPGVVGKNGVRKVWAPIWGGVWNGAVIEIVIYQNCSCTDYVALRNADSRKSAFAMSHFAMCNIACDFKVTKTWVFAKSQLRLWDVVSEFMAIANTISQFCIWAYVTYDLQWNAIMIRNTAFAKIMAHGNMNISLK